MKPIIEAIDSGKDLEIIRPILENYIMKDVAEAKANFLDSERRHEEFQMEFEMLELEDTSDMKEKIQSIDLDLDNMDYMDDFMTIVRSKANRTNLLESMNKLTAGSLCMATSGNATKYLNANGENFTLPVSTIDRDLMVESALPILVVICTSSSILNKLIQEAGDGIDSSEGALYKICEQRDQMQYGMLDYSMMSDDLKNSIMSTLMAPFVQPMNKFNFAQIINISEKAKANLNNKRAKLKVTKDENDEEDERFIQEVDKKDELGETILTNGSMNFENGNITINVNDSDSLTNEGTSLTSEDLKRPGKKLKLDAEGNVIQDQQVVDNQQKVVRRILETTSGGGSSVSYQVDSNMTINLQDISKASGLSTESVEDQIAEVSDLLKDDTKTTTNTNTETTGVNVFDVLGLVSSLIIVLFIA